MKILLATLSLDSRFGGGTAQRTRFLARYLKQARADCRVVTMQDGDLANDLRKRGIEVYATGFIKPRFHIPLCNPLRLNRLVQWADVLHITNYWSLLSVISASLARRHGRPYLLTGAGEFTGLESDRMIKHVFHRLVGARMIANAWALIAITELERQQLIELLRLDPKKVLVISNGIEPPRGASVEASNVPHGRFVAFMGRLNHIKGPDLLLDAFAAVAPQFPDVRLVFFGPDGGMLDELKARCMAARMEDRVVFAGFVDEASREAAYRRALLLAVPSRDEAMSLVALEAGVLGKAVLLTDRCGFDVVEKVGGGRVVPATVEGLREGLTDMLSRTDRLDEWGSRLQSYLLAHHSWPVIAERMLAHMRDAVVRRH